MKKFFSAVLLVTIMLGVAMLVACANHNDSSSNDSTLGKDLSVITVKKRDIPGDVDGHIDLITDEKELITGDYIMIDHRSVEYVINEDGTYVDKRTLPDETLLYGVYREDENTVSSPGYTIYHLIALYSYNPQ